MHVLTGETSTDVRAWRQPLVGLMSSLSVYREVLCHRVAWPGCGVLTRVLRGISAYCEDRFITSGERASSVICLTPVCRLDYLIHSSSPLYLLVCICRCILYQRVYASGVTIYRKLNPLQYIESKEVYICAIFILYHKHSLIINASSRKWAQCLDFGTIHSMHRFYYLDLGVHGTSSRTTRSS